MGCRQRATRLRVQASQTHAATRLADAVPRYVLTIRNLWNAMERKDIFPVSFRGSLNAAISATVPDKRADANARCKCWPENPRRPSQRHAQFSR